jgi:hypothetical protein
MAPFGDLVAPNGLWDLSVGSLGPATLTHGVRRRATDGRRANDTPPSIPILVGPRPRPHTHKPVVGPPDLE